MIVSKSFDESFLNEALQWYQRTNATPNRQISQEKIVEIYKKTKDYAESDPLLSEYYQANHLH